MTALVERAAELEAIDAALARTRHGAGGTVLVEGAAGTGKTALLRAARELATQREVRVLAAVGGLLEREFPFGVVRQLFEPVVLGAGQEERDRLLTGAAAQAAPLVGGEAVADTADPTFARLHGLYWLTAGLAEREPLLLVVDDAQWADAPSLRFAEFLARRAPELRVLVLVGLRPGEPGAETALLGALAESPAATTLRPAALSAAGVRTVVDELVPGDVGAEAVARALDATGGNPLLVTELAGTLAREGAEPTAAAVEAAVPSSVSRSVALRLGRLPDDARRVAQAVAVLGETAADLTLAAVCGLDRAAVAAALQTLREVDLLDDGVAYRHPLLGAAVAADVGDVERDRLHRAAATDLQARGADPELVVVHLMAAAPDGDPWLVDALRAGAVRADEEGAPDAALRRLLHARACCERLPGSGTVPPELELELGNAAAQAADPRAATHLRAAMAGGDPVVATRAAETRITVGAYAEDAELAELADLLRDAATSPASGLTADRRDRAAGQALNARILRGRDPTGYRRTLEDLRPTGHPTVLGHATWVAAGGDEPAAAVRAVAERALADRPFQRADEVMQPLRLWPLIALLVVDGDDLTDRSVRDAEATVRRTASALGRSFTTLIRAEWALPYGRLDGLEADLTDAAERFTVLGAEQSTWTVWATLLSVHVARGELDAAEAVAVRFPPDGTFDAVWGGSSVWFSRAELHLARGRAAAAVADLRRLDADVRRRGWKRFPRGTHTALLARALHAAGEREAALATARAEVAEQERRGALRLHAEALIALGEVDGDAAALEAALAVAGRTRSVRLQADAGLAFGRALRVAGHRTDARPVLNAARAAAQQVGARRTEALATEELMVAGGRPRRAATTGVDALTPAERRMAEHAATGMTNREIAETLFVTRKTVETTLGHVYAKLDIRSRAQLPAALGR